MGRVKELAFEDVHDEMQHSLSDGDIRKLLGAGTTVLLYPQLQDMQSVPFDRNGICVVLYLTENDHTGHWTLLLQRSSTEIEFFDSFGLPPDGDARWLNSQKRASLGESQQLIQAVLRRMKVENPSLQVYYNTRDFQSKQEGVDDCGRYVAARALLRHLSLDQFGAEVDASGMSPDEWVVRFTSARLGY